MAELPTEPPTQQTAMATRPDTNGSSSTNHSSASHQGISADEIALYDRQIRLWGMKAQERIRNANILLITMKALANEIAKNLVLAGIGSLTIVDHEVVTEPDLGAQFFLNSSHLGLNRAEAASAAIQRLNPRVKIHVSTADIRTQSPSFFSQFEIVIATDIESPNTLNLINTATRVNSRPFYAASSVGIYGFIFVDLIEHDFVISRNKSNLPTPLGTETRTRSITAVNPKPDNPNLQELVHKRELYSTWLLASDLASLPAEILKSPRRRKVVTPILSCLRALWEFINLYGAPPPNNHDALVQFTRICTEKHKALGLPTETLTSEILRSFLQNVGAEIAPVTAVLGGQLAQDVINVLGASQQPIQNFVIFDGDKMEAAVYALHPEGPLGKALFSEASSSGNAAAAMAAGVQNAVAAMEGSAAATAAVLAGLGPVDVNMLGLGSMMMDSSGGIPVMVPANPHDLNVMGGGGGLQMGPLGIHPGPPPVILGPPGGDGVIIPDAAGLPVSIQEVPENQGQPQGQQQGN